MHYDVLVMGSINMDMIVFVNDFPENGENVIAKSTEVHAGGKGANQAVAVAKQGVKHAFIGAVGNDDSGDQMIEILQNKGVETKYIIKKDDAQTGACVAVVDKKGENTLMGILGANMAITEEEIKKSFSNLSADILLLQLETSQESVLTALKIAKEKGMYIILDPAPEGCFIEEALSYADLVTPNRQETEKITGLKVTGIEEAKIAARKIADRGVRNVIVKLGSEGSVIFESDRGEYTFVEAKKVEAVDTIGAGDTFAGVLASVLSENKEDLIAAIKIATQASALKVSRTGGQDAIPTKEELNIAIKKKY